MSCQILHGDCRNILPTIGDATIDAIITDPPYELGFMGKRWDATGIAYDLTVWAECLRVLKPGGHLLAFGGTRTCHRMACAIEDAGFEIRDSIHWLYGSGFPKSLDVSKAIDKAAGAERSKIPATGSLHKNRNLNDDGWSKINELNPLMDSSLPVTDAAKQWKGWGTALKPAHEPIIVARKPLDGTVAATVLEHGTGALNIDGCRVGSDDGNRDRPPAKPSATTYAQDAWTADPANRLPFRAQGLGRWPANVVIDPHIADQHPEWANYYYCPKASTTERNTGLDGLPERNANNRHAFSGLPDLRMDKDQQRLPAANHHPTVKPLNLMRWLCRLVTPPGGLILDPFAGSGTTLTAAILEHFNTIGIELTDEYHAIIQARTRWAQTHVDGQLPL